MNFKTNFSKLALLSNDKIFIYFDDKTVEFVPPNIKLYLNDNRFLEFKSLMKQDVKNFPIKDLGFIVENEYDIFIAILKADYIKYEAEFLLTYLNMIFPNIEFNNSRLEIKGIKITYEEYMLLLDFLEVSCAEKDFDDFMNKVEKKAVEVKVEKPLSDLEKRMKENEEKLNSMKKKKNETRQGAITIDQIVIAIQYEFPSLRLDDIFKMNMFTLLNYWRYVGKVVDTQIQTIAAGNGLIKDFTYFIN
jgi:hypothetical protein